MTRNIGDFFFGIFLKEKTELLENFLWVYCYIPNRYAYRDLRCRVDSGTTLEGSDNKHRRIDGGHKFRRLIVVAGYFVLQHEGSR